MFHVEILHCFIEIQWEKLCVIQLEVSGDSVCVCVLQGPDQSTEVVRGPHCWRRTSGSHTAGAQGEAFAPTHTQTHHQHKHIQRCKQTNLLPLAATPANLPPPPPPPHNQQWTHHTTIHYSPPQSLMPYAILISRNALPLVLGIYITLL